MRGEPALKRLEINRLEYEGQLSSMDTLGNRSISRARPNPDRPFTSGPARKRTTLSAQNASACLDHTIFRNARTILRKSAERSENIQHCAPDDANPDAIKSVRSVLAHRSAMENAMRVSAAAGSAMLAEALPCQYLPETRIKHLPITYA